MVRVRRATGAVADALRRYDRNLDVRYSWEKQKWAVVYKTRRPDLLPKPVMFVETKAGAGDMKLMPELSENYISYRTRTYPVAYLDRLTWDACNRIIESDSMKASMKKRLQILADHKDAEYKRQQKERFKEARSYMNWHARTHIMAD